MQYFQFFVVVIEYRNESYLSLRDEVDILRSDFEHSARVDCHLSTHFGKPIQSLVAIMSKPLRPEKSHVKVNSEKGSQDHFYQRSTKFDLNF